MVSIFRLKKLLTSGEVSENIYVKYLLISRAKKIFGYNTGCFFFFGFSQAAVNQLEVIPDNWTQKFEPHGGQISKP